MPGVTWTTIIFCSFGIASLFVGVVDSMHMLAYKDMGVFRAEADLATQLWIAGRYVQSLSFLLAPVFLRRALNTRAVFAVYTGVVFGLLASIATRTFPPAT